MIRPKAILLISIFMDLLISSKMTKLPLVYEIYINIGTKVKKKEKGNQILTSIPKIGIEAAVSLLRNRMQPVDFYFNSRRNILFVKLRLVSTRIRDHPHLPQILSVEAQNLSPGPNVFYTSVTTRITFMHPTFVDTRTPLLPLSRRSCYPSRVRSFRRFAIGIYFLRTNAVIGQAHRATRSRALRRCVLSLLFCVVKGWRVLCETLVNFNFKCRIWLYCELSFYGIKQFLLINPLPYDSFLGYTYR